MKKRMIYVCSLGLLSAAVFNAGMKYDGTLLVYAQENREENIIGGDSGREWELSGLSEDMGISNAAGSQEQFELGDGNKEGLETEDDSLVMIFLDGELIAVPFDQIVQVRAGEATSLKQYGNLCAFLFAPEDGMNNILHFSHSVDAGDLRFYSYDAVNQMVKEQLGEDNIGMISEGEFSVWVDGLTECLVVLAHAEQYPQIEVSISAGGQEESISELDTDAELEEESNSMKNPETETEADAESKEEADTAQSPESEAKSEVESKEKADSALNKEPEDLTNTESNEKTNSESNPESEDETIPNSNEDSGSDTTQKSEENDGSKSESSSESEDKTESEDKEESEYKEDSEEKADSEHESTEDPDADSAANSGSDSTADSSETNTDPTTDPDSESNTNPAVDSDPETEADPKNEADPETETDPATDEESSVRLESAELVLTDGLELLPAAMLPYLDLEETAKVLLLYSDGSQQLLTGESDTYGNTVLLTYEDVSQENGSVSRTYSLKVTPASAQAEGLEEQKQTVVFQKQVEENIDDIKAQEKTKVGFSREKNWLLVQSVPQITGKYSLESFGRELEDLYYLADGQEEAVKADGAFELTEGVTYTFLLKLAS